jgi:hypothetical protein
MDGSVNQHNKPYQPLDDYLNTPQLLHRFHMSLNAQTQGFLFRATLKLSIGPKVAPDADC